MKLRDFVLLAVGFSIGALGGVMLTRAASLPARNSSAASALQAPAPASQSGQLDTATQRSFDTILAAFAANDYDRFLSVLDDGFRQRMTPTTFRSISESFAPRMQVGYTSTYLSHLRHKGNQISLWRVAFEDGGDDRLARLTMSQDRVTGLLITPVF